VVDVKEGKDINADEGDSKARTESTEGLGWQFIILNIHAPLNSETRQRDKCSWSLSPRTGGRDSRTN